MLLDKILPETNSGEKNSRSKHVNHCGKFKTIVVESCEDKNHMSGPKDACDHCYGLRSRSRADVNSVNNDDSFFNHQLSSTKFARFSPVFDVPKIPLHGMKKLSSIVPQSGILKKSTGSTNERLRRDYSEPELTGLDKELLGDQDMMLPNPNSLAPNFFAMP